ncbi:MAG: zinc ribbon domain-containing protein [Abditibacteriota bacterium]|nr:zinc ribbon domain-containing protein [Abditibacteriota bacterium]
MFCKFCGKEIAPGSAVCEHCGAKLVEAVNTSGTGNAAVVPEEIKGLNWSAFWFGWIWGLCHNVYVSLLVVITGAIGFIAPKESGFGGFSGVVGLVMSIFLLTKGNELAWRGRRFESVEEFKAVQAAWKKWLWPYIAFLVLLCVILIIVIALCGAKFLQQCK